MPDLRNQLHEYVEANVERINADHVLDTVSQPWPVSRPRPWLRPAWAFALGAAVVLTLGGMTWMLRAGGTGLEDAVSQPETPVASDEWNPILFTTKAGQPPLAATCRPGSDPNALGLTDQARPWGAAWSNQAAVFDQHAGRIVFIDEAADTWTFDVCTNTWSEMNPAFVPEDPSEWGDTTGWSGQLVYDVDSDRTIAFAGDHVAVYDANTNTWTRRSQPPVYDTRVPGSGVVYHSSSGLVVVQTQSGLVAYDVDADTWALIGNAGDGPYPPYLVGHITETDQFGLLEGDQGMLINSRSGESADLRAPGDGFAPFGRLHYATGTNSPCVLGDNDDVCRFDPATLDWTCISLAGGPGPGGAGLLGAMVGDPINDRLVLIYGYGPGFDSGRFYHLNAIWAIDFQTGEWTELLSATGPMTYELEE